MAIEESKDLENIKLEKFYESIETHELRIKANKLKQKVTEQTLQGLMAKKVNLESGKNKKV